MKYRIVIPESKEQFLYLINQTTKELNIQNQAYRKTILASYDKENSVLAVSCAAGSMNGGGGEQFRTTVESHDDSVVLEGEFMVLPYIKRGAQIFLIAMLIIGFLFSKGDPFLLGEVLIIFVLPLLLLYKNLQKIVGNEEGRQLVLRYFENDLNGEVEVIGRKNRED